MKRVILVAAILLAGCGQSAGEKAEAEYRIARESGVTSDQACEFETRIRDAYLSDENREKYQRWRIAAATSCNEAALERL